MIRLNSVNDCIPCPRTQYCTSGQIAGLCEKGYFCDFGASSAADVSKLCPPGHYCPEATDYPIRCPLGKYYGNFGAEEESWCTDCPLGSYCIVNDAVDRKCPKGMFCPLKTDRPYPCPIGTYNNAKGAYEESMCLDCPAGSYCYEEGIDNYEDYLCPIGHYCDHDKVTKPEMCPDGTYRNQTGAANMTDDCWPCPEGHYCPKG